MPSLFGTATGCGRGPVALPGRFDDLGGGAGLLRADDLCLTELSVLTVDAVVGVGDPIAIDGPVPLRLGATEPREVGFGFVGGGDELGRGGASRGVGIGLFTGVVARELARERGADGERAIGVVGDLASARLGMLSALKLNGGGIFCFGFSTSSSSSRKRKSRPYSWRSCRPKQIRRVNDFYIPEAPTFLLWLYVIRRASCTVLGSTSEL
jgi:hypothetical protein